MTYRESGFSSLISCHVKVYSFLGGLITRTHQNNEEATLSHLGANENHRTVTISIRLLKYSSEGRVIDVK